MTIRRDLLDAKLAQIEEIYLGGRILDIGGKKVNPRGLWRPDKSRRYGMEYLNIDASTNPDYLVSADCTGLEPSSYDCFLLCEVLEHVTNPEGVLLEARRILKPRGVGVITMPFLNQVHGDPADFQRWTAAKLLNELEQAGFRVLSVDAVGALPAVVFDLIGAGISRSLSQNPKLFKWKLASVCHQILKPIWLKADNLWGGTSPWITTGWVSVVTPSEGTP